LAALRTTKAPIDNEHVLPFALVGLKTLAQGIEYFLRASPRAGIPKSSLLKYFQSDTSGLGCSSDKSLIAP
jgi:hypothetical protein